MWEFKQTKQKNPPSFWCHLIGLFASYQNLYNDSRQPVGFKLIYHLLCLAGGSVNDFIDLKLWSYSCALLDYSIDKLQTDMQVRALGFSRY